MTKQECIKLYNQNSHWINCIKIIDQVPPKILNDSETFYKFYEEYKKLGGKVGYWTYDKNLRMFFKITFPTASGYLKKYEKADDDHWNSREEAFNCFVGYIKNYPEAVRYFKSVDNIYRYT